MQLCFEASTYCASYDQFAAAYLDDAFSALLVERRVLSARHTIDTHTFDDGRLRTRVRVVPHLELPHAIAQLVEGHLVYYDEIATYDPGTRLTALQIHTPAGELVVAHGTVGFIEHPSGLRLRFEGSVRVHVPLIGAQLERFIVERVAHGCQDVMRVLHEYVLAHG